MEYTHTGYEVGCDARTSPGYKRKILLRETKTLWISIHGSRYSKSNDGHTSGSYPLRKLDLATVTPNAELTGAAHNEKEPKP